MKWTEQQVYETVEKMKRKWNENESKGKQKMRGKSMTFKDNNT